MNGDLNALCSHGILNGRLTYDSTGKVWQTSLAVTNIFDKFYWQNKFDFFAIQGFVTGLPSRPREWSVSVKRKF